MRVVTGLIIGIACGISIGIIIDEIKTIHLFKKTKSS
jgi:ABC-type nitrate/sulfonate/bicarbonate transport system permease component